MELRTQLALNRALAVRAPPTPPRTPAMQMSRAAATSQLQYKKNECSQLNDDQVHVITRSALIAIIVTADTGIIVSDITNRLSDYM